MDNFKYDLKANPIKRGAFNYLVDYLQTLGIEKVSSFLSAPGKEDLQEPIKLENIDKLVDELKYGFDNNQNFFLQVDSDADGITSSAIFYNYFKELYPEAKIEWRVHNGKEHGVIYNTVPVYTDIVIIPDAGSNQVNEQYDLVQDGRKVLIMDHHHVDDFYEHKDVIIVNNQTSPEYKNKHLSGAGVVYKVIQHFSEKYHDGKFHETFMDLAALGIVSDMMDTRDLDNNYLIFHGLSNIKNKMFQAILNKQSYSVTSTTNPNKIDIAFYVTPLINAVIRAGSIEENEMLFEGFINPGSTAIIERVWRGETLKEDYYTNIARIASNIRGKQNRQKEKAMAFLDERIMANKLHENAILIVTTSKDDAVTVPKTMTGLVAMELVKKYRKPVLVLRPRTIKKKLHYFGSGRANKTKGFESFRDALNKSEIVVFAQGHDMAFGTGVAADKKQDLIDYLNLHYGHINFGSSNVEVDYIFENGDLDVKMLKDFAEHVEIYGNGIAQPKFVFKMLLSKDNLAVIGAKRNTVRINYKGISFIKFRAAELAEEIDNMSGLAEVTLIGRSQINEFMGKRSVQIIIDNIKFEEKKIKMLF